MQEYHIDSGDVNIVDGEILQKLIRKSLNNVPNFDSERPTKRAKLQEIGADRSISIPILKGTCLFDLGPCGDLLEPFNDCFTSSKEQYLLASQLRFKTINSEKYVQFLYNDEPSNHCTAIAAIQVKISDSTHSRFLHSMCFRYSTSKRAFQDLVNMTSEPYLYRSGSRFYIRCIFNFTMNRVTEWTTQVFAMSQERYSVRLLEAAFPVRNATDAITSRSFYDCLDRELDIFNLIDQPVELEGTLLPFQRRTLSWMWQREHPLEKSNSLPLLFEKVENQDGEELYLSRPLGLVQRDIESAQALMPTIRGGILAEEMGLGKTVEMISLILKHKFQLSDVIFEDDLEHIKTTLIITPSSILQQWIEELRKFAPHLKVYHYCGVNHPTTIDENYGKYDVVLTTYQVLSCEFYHAGVNPPRSLRYDKQYIHKVSPLVQYVWWRICLDEAQMIDSGVSKAAAVAAQLRRINAWAVTGTPIKNGLVDLYGLLIFLRFTPLSQAPFQWFRLIQLPSCQSLFKPLFRELTCRHTLNSVKSEMLLPPYTRVLFQLDLTVAEDEYYRHLFRQMLDFIGLTEQLTPIYSDWSLQQETEKMRKWLVRLRQICVHPRVGQANRTLMKEARPLQTVEAVVDTMIEQCLTALWRNQRHFLSNKIKRGQLYEQVGDKESALHTWNDVSELVKVIIEPLRREGRDMLEEKSWLVDMNDVEKSEDKTVHETEKLERFKKAETLQTKITALNKRLRIWLEFEHRALFFIASVHFAQGNTEQENIFYEKAEIVRHEILKESEANAMRLMKELRIRAEKKDFVIIPEISDVTSTGSGVFERIQLVGRILNEQALQLDKWRQIIIDFLTSKIVDNDTTPDGEEYTEGLDAQGECTSYLEAFRRSLMDRTFLILNTQSSLQEYEHYHRHMEVVTELDNELRKVRKSFLDIPPATKIVDQEPVDTLKNLDDTLKDLFEADLKAEELEMIWKERARLDDVKKRQTKACRSLEKEYETMRSLLNSRIEYFRQLQQISDSVVQYTVEEPDMEINRLLDEEAIELAKIEQAESRYRYLVNLKAEETSDQFLLQKPTTCIICTDTFDVGAITICGHIFCDDCLKRCNDFRMIGFQKKGNYLSLDAINPASQTISSYGFYMNANQELVQEVRKIDLKGSFGTKIDFITRHLMYLQQKKPEEKSVVFSQWVDVLEILQTALSTNGVKCIRFDNKTVKRRSTYDPASKFKADPEIRVFMLHSRTQSSGLTLVNARNVFLCEPLLQSSIEAQAISRVHRMGQKHKINVFLYTIRGTVEERIHERAMHKRAEHEQINQNHARMPSGADGVDETTEMQQNVASLVSTLKYGGGEIVEDKDLPICLFGKCLE
ncbi:putative ATP-dependent helicase [Neolecta irregularis DAH-3]|uniref:Putative ATP-dependent helicase n=1 Tax=Neolecta irregularis (strain DAH-3) TaxID=1198029 RepID=A0A1U7LML5_NEOID|nr:putative ATP-dependent helicase [Neolecta irregularis DAH-3]|eukprot:OLL23782.1 putative ATP-dependent helicase [Neolecta irregularis DAH-3]